MFIEYYWTISYRVSRLSSPIWKRTSPIAIIDTLVCIRNSLSKFGYNNKGPVTKIFLKSSNALAWLSPHTNGCSFFVNVVSGSAIVANVGTNL